MTLTTIILDILLTIPLTFVLNYLERNNNSKLSKIVVPTIYTILIAAIFPSLKTNIFLIVIFEIFIRNFYITNMVERENNNLNGIVENILSIILSLFVYNYFISKVDTVIPNPEDIKGFIWFLLLVYLLYLIKINNKDKETTEKEKEVTYKKEQVVMEYAKFKNKYADSIKTEDEIVNDLLYSIMIFENYKTPKIYRKLNEYINTFKRSKTKYGIMQVESYNRISDLESINIVKEELESNLDSKLRGNKKLTKLLSNYKKEEQNAIISIYKEIVEFKSK